MNKVTKNLERALAALQLVNNELERQRIMKHPIIQTDEQQAIEGKIHEQLSIMDKYYMPF
jgi:hypothetical protein